MSARLEARALACSRGSTTLFRGLSFALAAGECLAVRGPNGSGKTTLLRCVAGLAAADAGEVLWDGESTRGLPARWRASLLYAGHLAGVKDDLSAEENLQCALGLRGVSVAAPALARALGDVGLAKRRHLPARRLSAGQRRRVGLARLMLDPAECWALDEPLTALDDDGQRLFGELLAAHLARGGVALLATHQDLAPAAGRELRIGA